MFFTKETNKLKREKNIKHLPFFWKIQGTMQSVMLSCLKPCQYSCWLFSLLFFEHCSFDGEIFMRWQIMNTWNCFQLKWMSNGCSLWFWTNMSANIFLGCSHCQTFNVNSQQNRCHRSRSTRIKYDYKHVKRHFFDYSLAVGRRQQSSAQLWAKPLEQQLKEEMV